MKGFLLGIFFTILAIAATVFFVSRWGLYPIGADNPPSGLERSLAGRAMDVYADKHKPAGDNPAALTSANLIEGATEYEAHCAFCHGGAKARISPMRDKFNPPVPQLVDRVPHDDAAWLFWVTKHGVRMTGMPTWDGILTDQEIWNVVLFLKHSDKLPPDVQAAWQQAASTPGEIEEHTSEQHEKPISSPHPQP
jgi:mono/diheme cytochrome c family protein